MTRDMVIKIVDEIIAKYHRYKGEFGEEPIGAWLAMSTVNEIAALLKDGDMVRVVRCAECEHWEPSNAEEGDYSGRCRNNWGPCQNQQTDGTWYCADGARMEVDA